MENPQIALETLVREELGLDPSELGSPWGASIGSFLAFAIGALVPVIPFLFGANASLPFVVASAGLAAVSAFAVGASLSLFTGRHPLLSGGRQVALGAIAAPDLRYQARRGVSAGVRSYQLRQLQARESLPQVLAQGPHVLGARLLHQRVAVASAPELGRDPRLAQDLVHPVAGEVVGLAAELGHVGEGHVQGVHAHRLLDLVVLRLQEGDGPALADGVPVVQQYPAGVVVGQA
jgi:hypothetical protein